jgi:hypothetical protein
MKGMKYTIEMGAKYAGKAVKGGWKKEGCERRTEVYGEV